MMLKVKLHIACGVELFFFTFPELNLTASFFFFKSSVTEWETAPAVAETPEIKLFGKWSTDDVQINDISLQVSNRDICCLCQLCITSTVLSM